MKGFELNIQIPGEVKIFEFEHIILSLIGFNVRDGSDGVTDVFKAFHSHHTNQLYATQLITNPSSEIQGAKCGGSAKPLPDSFTIGATLEKHLIELPIACCSRDKVQNNDAVLFCFCMNRNVFENHYNFGMDI